MTSDFDKNKTSSAANDRASYVSNSSSSAAKQKHRVLLVDDCADNRMLISITMRNSSYVFDEAEHGAAAVEKYRQGEYDAILMDMQMPVLDGYDATRQIRQMERESGREPTPIIAISGHSFHEDMDKTAAAGCDIHLTKPIQKVKLLECLDMLVGRNV